MSCDEPVFIVRDAVSGHEYKVWASGQIEGFGSAGIVINKIPQMLAEALESHEEFRTD